MIQTRDIHRPQALQHWKRQSATGIVVLLLTASPALANAGTPLLWANAFHLLLGNIFIGIFEGWLISRLFKIRNKWLFPVMILANYFSFIAGMAGLAWFNQTLAKSPLFQPPVHYLPTILISLGVATYLASIILEWPFCWFIVRKSPRPIRTATLASLVAQTTSYAILTPLYFLISSFSLITNADWQNNLSFVKNKESVVYFIGLEDGAVWRMHMDGREKQKVIDAGLVDPGARLFVKPSKNNNNKVDLWCVPGDQQSPRQLLTALASKAVPLPRTESMYESATWGNFNAWGISATTYDLRQDEPHTWDCKSGFSAYDGIRIYKDNYVAYQLALETAYTGSFQWSCRNLLILPGDQCIFQTEDQLLILDMPTKKMGFLTMGRGPVVTLEPQSEPRP